MWLIACPQIVKLLWNNACEHLAINTASNLVGGKGGEGRSQRKWSVNLMAMKRVLNAWLKCLQMLKLLMSVAIM